MVIWFFLPIPILILLLLLPFVLKVLGFLFIGIVMYWNSSPILVSAGPYLAGLLALGLPLAGLYYNRKLHQRAEAQRQAATAVPVNDEDEEDRATWSDIEQEVARVIGRPVSRTG
jgi:amino acid transporter